MEVLGITVLNGMVGDCAVLFGFPLKRMFIEVIVHFPFTILEKG
jgi:hypothetical protein